MTAIITHLASWFESVDACTQASDALKQLKYTYEGFDYQIYIESCETEQQLLTACVSYKKDSYSPALLQAFLYEQKASLVVMRCSNDYFGEDGFYATQAKKKITPEVACHAFAEHSPEAAVFAAILLNADIDLFCDLLEGYIAFDPNKMVGNRPLIELAAAYQQPDTVEELINKGAIIDLQSVLKLDDNYYPKHKGNTALHHAVMNNNRSLVKKLLHYKANINIANHYGNTPLHEVLLSGQYFDNIELLIYCNADLIQANQTGLSPFLLLVGGDRHDTKEIIRLANLMLEKGVPLNQTCSKGGNALWYAADNPQVVAFLNKRGLHKIAVPSDAYSGRMFADLDIAIRVNDSKLANTYQQQLEKGLTPVEKNQLLYAAIDYNSVDIAESLLEAGADLNYTISQGMNLYTFAKKCGNKKMLNLLYELDELV